MVSASGENQNDRWNLSTFLLWANSGDTHIFFPKWNSVQQEAAPRQKPQKLQRLGPWLEMQRPEYNCVVSDANLQLPHIKAEAKSSTKANSVIEPPRGA